MQPLILINAVGLTRRLLAFAPRLKRLAENGEGMTLVILLGLAALPLAAGWRRRLRWRVG